MPEWKVIKLDPAPRCSVEGCGISPVVSRGWCEKHYKQWWVQRTNAPRPAQKRIGAEYATDRSEDACY